MANPLKLFGSLLQKLGGDAQNVAGRIEIYFIELGRNLADVLAFLAKPEGDAALRAVVKLIHDHMLPLEPSGHATVIPAPKVVTANPFAVKEEDPDSPFGSCDLSIALAEKSSHVSEMHLYLQKREDTASWMIAAMGGKDGKEAARKHVFTPAEIRAIVDLQKDGQSGLLPVDGWHILFFVEAKDGSLAVASVDRGSDDPYWGVCSSRPSLEHLMFSRFVLRAA